MPKRKLYPTRLLDRFLIWVVIVAILGSLWLTYTTGPFLGWYHWLLLLVAAFSFWAIPYFLSDWGKEDVERKYSIVISNIESMGRQLTSLLEFLKQERTKLAEWEATLRRLQDEKTELEPVVTTYRGTVNAILSAHSRTTTSRVWKERALGFMSGLLTSLLASALLEYIKR